MRAFEPYNKIALDFGVRPLINRHEATNPDILARVTIVPGLDGLEVPDAIARITAWLSGKGTRRSVGSSVAKSWSA